MTPPAFPLLDLHALRLDDARALLEHGGTDLPAPEQGAAPYLQRIIDGLCALSLRDPLTGLANQRHFRAVLTREIEIVARSGNSALLLMLDIDHFKKINDGFGHDVGDEVLKEFAVRLASNVRAVDLPVRYGGEEFVIVMPDTRLVDARRIAERIRLHVAGSPFRVMGGKELLSVTISIGVATSLPGEEAPQSLLKRADEAVYEAKASGRNRVIAHAA